MCHFQKATFPASFKNVMRVKYHLQVRGIRQFTKVGSYSNFNDYAVIAFILQAKFKIRQFLLAHDMNLISKIIGKN